MVFSSILQTDEDVPLNYLVKNENLVINENLRSISPVIFEDSEGKQINLKDYQGNLIIINFWATWCAPCREEIPELNEFYKNKDINLIAIAIDEIADVIKFQDEIPIQYPSFIANELEGVTLAKKLGNERGVLPFTVIIQPDGSVKKSFYGKVKISDLNQALSDNSI